MIPLGTPPMCTCFMQNAGMCARTCVCAEVTRIPPILEIITRLYRPNNINAKQTFGIPYCLGDNDKKKKKKSLHAHSSEAHSV